MIDKVEGAGTRMIKIGSNLPIHGVVGKFGIYRFANLLGLVRSPRPRRAARKGPRGARLERIHLARRSGARPSVRAWAADVGHGLQRPAVLEAGHPDRQEPDRKQDARVALAQRSAWSAAASWSTSRRSTTARHEERTTGFRVRPGLSDTAVLLGVTKILIDNSGTTPTSAASSPIFRCWCGPTRSSGCGRRTSQADYQPEGHFGGPVVQGARPDRRAAATRSATFACGTATAEAGRVHQPRRSRREHDDQRGAGRHVPGQAGRRQDGRSDADPGNVQAASEGLRRDDRRGDFRRTGRTWCAGWPKTSGRRPRPAIRWRFTSARGSTTTSTPRCTTAPATCR